MRMSIALALALVVFGSLADHHGMSESAMIKALQQKSAELGVASSILFFSTPERRVAFKNIDQLYPTRLIERGEDVYELGDNPADLSNLEYEVDGETFLFSEFKRNPGIKGLIVVKDEDIAHEWYAEGNNREMLWISFSVTKSVTSMLIGAAIADGYIESVDEPVVHYLPRLRGTGYESATIQDVLNMASGVSWNEDYADPHSDVANAGSANGLDLVRYLSGMPREHEPGQVFNYNTGETNLVGEILRSAIGNNATTYLTHRIWQPFGMEYDANWLLNEPGGVETGGCCISATLRDYARIGLFAMEDGILTDGSRVLPKGWMNASTSPSTGADFYGYLWWLREGSYSAQGIFGQHIWINPDKNLVIAVHSNAPTATGSDYQEHLSAVLNAIDAMH